MSDNRPGNPFAPQPHAADRLETQERHRRLAQIMLDRCEGVVQAGPVAGFRLPGIPRWSRSAIGPILLGTYEHAVADALVRLARTSDLLIDIGAADGYYGIGLVANGTYRRSVCFESDQAGQAVLLDAALRNGVANSVSIFGKADDTLLDKLAAAGIDAPSAVVLCDIEGGEFALFTSELLERLRHCHLVIELHDAYYGQRGTQMLDSLKTRAAAFFTVETIFSNQRPLPDHPCLDGFTKDERMMLASEGRTIAQEWLLLSPRA